MYLGLVSLFHRYLWKMKNLRRCSSERLKIKVRICSNTDLTSTNLNHKKSSNANLCLLLTLLTSLTGEDDCVDAKPIFSQSQLPYDFGVGFSATGGGCDDDDDAAYEKVEFQQGLFVSRAAISDTFFHRVEPSKKVSFHLNPVKAREAAAMTFEHGGARSGDGGRASFFSKFKAFVRENCSSLNCCVRARVGISRMFFHGSLPFLAFNLSVPLLLLHHCKNWPLILNIIIWIRDFNCDYCFIYRTVSPL